MVELVDEDDVKRELEHLGIFINEKRVLSAFRKMCLLYNTSAAKLADNWFEYKTKNRGVGEKPSDGHLEVFEKNYLTQEYIRENVIGKDSGDPDLMDIEQKVEQTVKKSVVDPDVKEEEMEETDLNANEDLTADEKNVLFQKSVVASSHGSDSLLESDFTSTSSVKLEVIPIDDSKHAKQQDLNYCGFNLYDMCCCFEEQLKQTASLYSQRMGIPVVTDLSVDLTDDACYLCYVRKQGHRVRLNAESMLVEGTGDTYDNDYVLKHLAVDLSQLSAYSFFSGQMIAFKGLRVKDKMRITSVLDVPSDPPTDRTFTKTEDALQFLVVSGPFDQKVEPLIKYVADTKPHLIILIGPFVDARDFDAVVARDDDESFMKTLVAQLCVAGAGKVVVVSSMHDLHAVNLIPTPALSLTHANAISFPNPCYFEVNGIRFAVTSADILKHMMKQEFSSGLSDRMKRMVSQILSQRRFYPLFPVDREANVDYRSYSMLQLPCKPDFLMIPSDLMSFVMDVDNCLCVNPQRLTKGFVSRIRVKVEGNGIHSDVQVFRL